MNASARGSRAAFVLVLVLTAQAGAAGFRWSAHARQSDDWFRGQKARAIADNLLSQQSARGDWPKNYDTGAEASRADPDKIKGTFDNGATVGEIRFLARSFRVNGNTAYRDAALKGIDHILESQYPNGGWPQTAPPGTGYPRHITFNDNTMSNLMTLLRDVATTDEFAFAGPERRQKAQTAFDRGIQCILRCQIRVNGALTAWCAQHDEKTLEPAQARSYELPSLSGGESAGLLLLLMSLDHPSPEVIQAVDAGAKWYETAAIHGIREKVVDGDKVIQRDPTAKPIWARFYDIRTNRPFFCGRDGVKHDDVAEIEAERRNGYAWYGYWGEAVANRYRDWKKERRGD